MSNSAQTSAGTTFGVTAAQPTTRDLAGFAALTYNTGDKCEITRISEVSTSWSTVTDETLCADLKTKQKATESSEPVSIELYFVKSDTMQNILLTAFNQKTGLVSIEITDPNGTDKTYFVAQVTKYKKAYGKSDEFIKLTIELEFQHKPVIS